MTYLRESILRLIFSALYEELADSSAPVDDGFMLTLPSGRFWFRISWFPFSALKDLLSLITLFEGAKIGHRALLRYYKQNIRGVEASVSSRLAIEKVFYFFL